MKMIFEPLGEGKCKLKRIEAYGDEGTIEIPDFSEEGDRVVAVDRFAFGNCGARVYFPDSIQYIDEDVLESNPTMASITICAPRHSYAIQFARKYHYRYEISDYKYTWNSSAWLSGFQKTSDYRSFRREVWKNTLDIVADGGYNTASGYSISLYDENKHYGFSKFYSSEFSPIVCCRNKTVEITVVSDDCLDVAHNWVSQNLTVSVLNMASRRHPGGGVKNGAGAQEEYLFRCSDYYRSLYRYAEYASMYGIKPANERYPLDCNYGGIYSENITIFRENEHKGYALLEKPWTVNMIAVPGMNSPELEQVNGETRIATYLVNGVKNKIRTIFRIAIDNGQTNLVLGALGCGAFNNPPKHVAELFRDVLCEPEFRGAFERICFAVKADHNSHGSKNYDAFYGILNGFVPITNEM